MRLRDMGGLLVVDFIDMDTEDDKESVVREFKKAIRQDTAPVSFSPLSPFGLMEITRKRIRPDAVSEQTLQCPTCHGAGYIPSRELVLAQVDRWLRRHRAKKGTPDISLALNAHMIELLTDNRAQVFKYLESTHKARIQLLEDDEANLDEFRVFSTTSGEELTTGTAAA
jgi:ribonuclease G